MQSGINKYASLVVQGEISRILNNSNSTLYSSSQELPKMNCYIYQGISFSSDLEFKTIIQRMNNKVRKALYSIKGFLKNPHIPIPYKPIFFYFIVIGQVSYFVPLLRSIKERTRSTQTLVNSGLYWIEEFSNGNSFTSLYCVSKVLNIPPPLSAKCIIVLVMCFKKWKNTKCIFSDLLKAISHYRRHAWDIESKILVNILDKFPLKKATNFYWVRDMAGKSIKAKAYKKI